MFRRPFSPQFGAYIGLATPADSTTRLSARPSRTHTRALGGSGGGGHLNDARPPLALGVRLARTVEAHGTWGGSGVQLPVCPSRSSPRRGSGGPPRCTQGPKLWHLRSRQRGLVGRWRIVSEPGLRGGDMVFAWLTCHGGSYLTVYGCGAEPTGLGAGVGASSRRVRSVHRHARAQPLCGQHRPFRQYQWETWCKPGLPRLHLVRHHVSEGVLVPGLSALGGAYRFGGRRVQPPGSGGEVCSDARRSPCHRRIRRGAIGLGRTLASPSHA